MSDKIYDVENGMPVPRDSTPRDLAEPAGSGEWAPILVSAIVANCRQQIATLRMKMPLNVALALGRADEDLADCQAWIRAEQHNRPEEKG